MLHFVLGDKNSGKSQALYTKALSLDAQKEHVFFIVPEQNSLSVQQRLLEASSSKCLLNTEVLSFNRLAHRIFEEMGAPKGSPADDLGKSLLLYEIACANKDRLQYFNTCFQKPGFIGRLKLFLTEMEQYAPQMENLLNKASEEKQSVFDLKMKDLALLYDAYVARLGTTLYNSEHILDHLAIKLRDSKLAQNSSFFFDGFSGFTPQQYEVLSVILSVSKDVTVALTLPKPVFDEIRHLNDWHSLPNGLFHETSKTFIKLQGLAAGKKLASEIAFTDVSQAKPLFFAQSFASFEEELEHALKEMLQLMREHHYRLRDIALVMPQMEEKSHIIARRMDAYGFGYHINTKTNLSMHPLAQLLFQAIRMVLTDFQFDPVFAFFKTGLTPLSDNELNVLEVEAKAFNLRGRAMFCEELKKHTDWHGAETVLSAILPFADFCAQNDKISVNCFIGQIRGLFDALRVSETLNRKFSELDELEESARDNATLASQFRRAREEYACCLRVFEKCLSDMSLFSGDLMLTPEEMYDLFSIGFSQSAVAVVPSSVDSLLVADVSGSCVEKVKALFVLGLGSSQFPGSVTNPGLFTQKERLKLNAAMELAPDEGENIDLKYHKLYSLLGKATERVYLSAPKTTPDGKKEEPCLLWPSLQNGSFSGFAEAKPWPSSSEYTLAVPYMEEHGLQMDEDTKKFLKHTRYKRSVDVMDMGAGQKNISEKIRPETAGELFEKLGTGYSISRLESYARCPYQFFLDYGLHVEVPKEPEVTALENGNLMHRVLENAGKLLIAYYNRSDMAADMASDAKSLVDTTFAQLKDNPDYSVFQTTARYRHYWEKMNKGAVDVISELSQMISKTEFKPSAFEWKFGNRANVRLTLRDAHGEPFELIGKIDRIDVLDTGTDRYVSIVDYKTGKTAFSEDGLNAGIEIQLPIYMKAACELYNPEDASKAPSSPNKPAGFFYYRVFEDKMINGKALADYDIVTKLDNTAEDGKAKPRNYSVQINNDGSFSKTSQKHIAEPEVLRQYEDTAVQCAQNSVSGIRSGDIGMRPYATFSHNKLELKGCEFCAYSGNCGLDRRLPEIPCRLVKETEESGEEDEE